MPNTVTSLVLFLIILLPGYAYLVGMERNGPERQLTGLRLLASIAIASIASQLTSLVVLALGWTRAIDVRSLLTDPVGYWQAAPYRIITWFLVNLALATVLAYLASFPRVRRKINIMLQCLVPRKYRADSEHVHPSITSAWWRIFNHYPDKIKKIYNQDKAVVIRATCVLDSGVQIEGDVAAFNPVAADLENRDIILSHPLKRAEPDDEWRALPSDYVCLSARNIVELYVKYEYLPGEK